MAYDDRLQIMPIHNPMGSTNANRPMLWDVKLPFYESLCFGTWYGIAYWVSCHLHTEKERASIFLEILIKPEPCVDRFWKGDRETKRNIYEQRFKLVIDCMPLLSIFGPSIPRPVSRNTGVLSICLSLALSNHRLVLHIIIFVSCPQ